LKILSDIANGIIKFLTAVGCRIDSRQLVKIPARGPLILTANHINFLETPVIFPRLFPRPVTALAKIEYWDSLFFRFLFNLWKLIPIRRGEADLEAFQKALAAMQAGKILIILPEGTRSSDGKMQEAHAGIVLLAVRSGAPILPVAHWGGENVWENLKHFKRTDFKIAVGNPFKVETGGKALSRDVRQQIANEIMYQIAALLPENYRGVYTDISKATEDYLRFEPGVESNLPRIK
jgi:1-acyl-sn-glycerol-3-phosphate acyltransferase